MRGARWPVWLIVLLALVAELLPLPQALQPFRPIWTTLIVIYWTLMWPGRFGMASAFIIGLLVDVAHGSLLGQHALTLCAVAYVVLRFHLQMRVFTVWQLTLSVLALVFLEAFLMLWIDGITGHVEFGPERWGPVLASAAAWPVVMVLMERVRERLERRDSSFS